MHNERIKARFKTVSQLNQKVEKLTSEAQDFEKGRNVFEIFLENLKTSIRRGNISFQSEEIVSKEKYKDHNLSLRVMIS